MADVVIEGVTKYLGGSAVVRDMSLRLADGEAVSLLGPSGCGKTTTLNMIAGFLQPDAGTIAVGGRQMRKVPPYRRNIGVVFQNYALFPHLTVAGNVAFGLEMRKLNRTDTKRRVEEVLSLVHLTGFSDRFPRQLSGGQQQRVALARALAIQPSVLLLDEPLSNLDAKLRAEVRDEIVEVHRRTGLTMIFVTHDQEEALVISDRVVVINAGVVQQVGTPDEVYGSPSNRFVAGFIGEANFIDGVIEHQNSGRTLVRVGGSVIAVAGKSPDANGRVVLMVRPECIGLSAIPPAETVNTYSAQLDSVSYLGSQWRYRLRVFDQTLLVSRPADSALPSQQLGATVHVSWRPEDARILPSGASAHTTPTSTHGVT